MSTWKPSFTPKPPGQETVYAQPDKLWTPGVDVSQPSGDPNSTGSGGDGSYAAPDQLWTPDIDPNAPTNQTYTPPAQQSGTQSGTGTTTNTGTTPTGGTNTNTSGTGVTPSTGTNTNTSTNTSSGTNTNTNTGTGTSTGTGTTSGTTGTGTVTNPNLYVGALAPGAYWIRNAHSKGALDLSQGDPTPGKPIVNWVPHGGEHQKWILESGTAGYKVKNAHTKTYLSFATNVSAAQNSSVSGNPTPVEWELVALGSNYQLLLAKNRSLVLDLADWKNNNGNRIIVWSNHKGANQQWIFEKV
ncbi:hypothetical protein FRC03_001268 [Tulasnella sp. 419]|nr:hypothetical protein FRC03_001268 [Tulasnella sp. 419]